MHNLKMNRGARKHMKFLAWTCFLDELEVPVIIILSCDKKFSPGSKCRLWAFLLIAKSQGFGIESILVVFQDWGLTTGARVQRPVSSVIRCKTP